MFKDFFMRRRIKRHIATVAKLCNNFEDKSGFGFPPQHLTDWVMKELTPDEIDPFIQALRSVCEESRMQKSLENQRREMVLGQLTEINKVH